MLLRHCQGCQKSEVLGRAWIQPSAARGWLGANVGTVIGTILLDVRGVILPTTVAIRSRRFSFPIKDSWLRINLKEKIPCRRALTQATQVRLGRTLTGFEHDGS